MARMIIFDGVSIDSVANVKIEDVKVNPIQYDDVTRVRAVSPGSVFVRSRAGTRTVVVTFALPDDDMTHRQSSLLSISQWAKTDKEYKLELPGHPEHYLMAVCTSKPEPSLRMWWESKLRLVFTCFDNPFWNSKTEKIEPFNSPFFILGDAEPLVWIEKTISEATGTRSYSLDDRTMSFSQLPVGKIHININKQTAISVIGNTVTDLMQYYKVSSKFPIPRTGLQTWTGTGAIHYRERWE